MNKSVFISLIGILGISSAAYMAYQALQAGSASQANTEMLSMDAQEEAVDLSGAQSEQPLARNTPPIEQPLKKSQGVVSSLPLSARKELVSEWSDLSEFSEQQLQMANSSGELWSLSHKGSINTSDLPLDSVELSDGRAFFEANQAKVAMMLPGDSVSIALPDTNEVIALDVKSVASPNEGLVKVKGLVAGQGNQTFNMIRGAGYVSGHINTATNTYSFEMHGNTGWVHESGALFTGELHADDPDHDHDHDDSHVQDDGIVVVARGSDQSPSTIDKVDADTE